MEKETQTKTKITKPITTKLAIKNDKVADLQSIANEATTFTTDIVEDIKAISENTLADIKNIDFTESFEKIADSANALNTQLKVTATEIADEVKDITVEATKVAKNTVKQITKKVDVTGNVTKAKKAAVKLNNEIVENVEDFKKNTVKLANEMVENLNVTDRLETVKKSLNKANELAVKNTSEMIDGVEFHVEKWQGVAEKAIKTGLKLVDNQSNIMFTTLEAVKTQVGKTSNRFKNLFTV